MKQIPNLFTLLNLVFGCLAVIFILQTGEGVLNYNGEEWKVYLPEKIWWGSICIGCAAIVDFLDGFLARLMKVNSAMGKQLDSLADVVSFGVAPGMIMYQLLRIANAYEPDGINVAFGALLPALLFPAAAAWRLAKFNLDESQAYGFKGVPTPAAGLFVGSLPLILLYNYFNIQEILINKWVLYLIIVLLSCLMISNLPLLSLKFKNFSIKNSLHVIILAIIAVISAFLAGWLAVPIVFVAYILVSLLLKKQTA
jgi:CDP-diacylglycerol--serine O-phosphatidyltransferase